MLIFVENAGCGVEISVVPVFAVQEKRFRRAVVVEYNAGRAVDRKKLPEQKKSLRKSDEQSGQRL